MSKHDHRSVASESDPDPTSARQTGLIGQVLLPDGTPAVGALVALSAEEGNPDIAASTNGEGFFHLSFQMRGGGTVTARLGPLRASVSVDSQDKSVALHLKEISHE